MPVTRAQIERQRRFAQKGGGAGWLVFNPSAGLRIGGVDYSAYVVRYSPSLKFAISPYAGTFSCQLDGPRSALAAITVEQELTYNRDGVLYAGIVRAVTPTDQVTASANVTLTIDAQDFTTLLDRDICAYASSAPQVSPVRSIIESDLQRIGWLVQSFGRRGLTLHHVQQNYSSVPAKDYSGMTLKAAIKDVLSFSGGSFYVDSARDLHCFIDEKQYAPFTLSETPDNATSFPYADLGIPGDSVDLRNAWYGIPKASAAPSVADQVTVIPSTDPTFGTDDPAVMAIFKVAGGGAKYAQVGNAGAFLTGTNTSVSPLFGQATSAGNLLIATVESDSADATTLASGWVQAVALRRPAGLAAAIWYKPNCGAGEAAPTFTAAGGLGPMTAQLFEVSGAPLTDVLDQVKSDFTNAASITLLANAIDASAGELVVVSSHWGWASNVTTTFSEIFTNGMTTVHLGDDGAVSQNHHASHCYAIGKVSGAVARWYTDEASIALYGRQEDSFSDTTVTAQADLDALGAAKLAQFAYPRQEGSFKCRTAGLTVGQRFTIQSSLYTVPVNVDPLGNYSGVIQGIEVSYSEDEPGPLFAVEFMEPTVNLAVQLGDVIASIPPATAAPIKLGDFRARAHATGGQSIGAGANTKIQLAVKDADPSGCFDATSLYRYTAKVAGTYDIQAAINLAAQVGANYYIAVNGSLSAKPSIRFANTAGAVAAAMSGGDQIYLGVGDYVELWVFCGTATTIEATNELLKNATFLAISLLAVA